MTVSADIYKISEYVEGIKNKFIDAPEDTLAMGMFGYLSEVNSGILQNSVVMISEYSNEAIPVKAKFEKNIITHALSLGIKKIQATTATMDVMLLIPEEALLLNMKNDKFTLDKSIKIFVENFEYHIDYDIIINKVNLLNGESTYTALYDMTTKNSLSNITNPYLPPLGRIKITNINLIAINCSIRQIEYIKIHKKILTDNPLENKIINFSFESQLAYFDVDVIEGDKTIHLNPVYDGLQDYSANSGYCNYSYIDIDNIRIKFNRDSYEPRVNCDVIINLYTTQGSKGNFKYTQDIMLNLDSDRFVYDKIFMIIKPISDSSFGADKKSIEDLKVIIPKEALSRGSITNYTDLNNFFNSINDANCKLYFLEKIHNQLQRSYFSYILLKKDNTIIPTNTIDVTIQKQHFNSIKNNNYVFNPGNTISYTRGKDGIVKVNPTDADVIELEKTGFVYINPFMSVVNKSPFYISYYLNIMNTTKFLNFDYINQNSKAQFISSSINWKREYFTDRDTYKLNISLLQNIRADLQLVEKDDAGNIVKNNIKVIGVLYNDLGVAYKYCIAELKHYDDSSYIYDYEFKITTTDAIDKNGKVLLENTYRINTNLKSSGYFSANTKMDIYMLVKSNDDNNRAELDKIVPGLEGYTLCNRYGVISGIDLYYNYSSIISSYVKVTKLPNTSLNYTIRKLPLLKKSYIDTEEKIQYFVKELEKRRHYIEYCLLVLEDSFGIDFKFFNTYGPSELYDITTDTRIDKTNLKMSFRIKFVSVTDKYILDKIKADIKTYLENINEVKDFHIPNLITLITNTYREQLVYFEFVDINGNGPAYQHITQIADTNINIVPEFLNIDTKKDGTPDITITIDP